MNPRSSSTASASRTSTPIGGIALTSGSSVSPENAKNKMLVSGDPGTIRIPDADALLCVGTSIVFANATSYRRSKLLDGPPLPL
jgi:hypothetical protein